MQITMECAKCALYALQNLSCSNNCRQELANTPNLLAVLRRRSRLNFVISSLVPRIISSIRVMTRLIGYHDEHSRM
eukprot:scaffold61599_cov72-Cyclotella_meneghiniana.AAC.2